MSRQFAQCRCQVYPTKAEAAADADDAARLLPCSTDLHTHLFHIMQYLAGPVVDALSRFSHGNAPGGAIQQATAEALLQHANPLADIGRGRGHGFCRCGKSTLAHDQRKYPQIFKLQQILHVSCFLYARNCQLSGLCFPPC
jgi:hypothetical protein